MCSTIGKIIINIKRKYQNFAGAYSLPNHSRELSINRCSQVWDALEFLRNALIILLLLLIIAYYPLHFAKYQCIKCLLLLWMCQWWLHLLLCIMYVRLTFDLCSTIRSNYMIIEHIQFVNLFLSIPCYRLQKVCSFLMPLHFCPYLPLQPFLDMRKFQIAYPDVLRGVLMPRWIWTGYACRGIRNFFLMPLHRPYTVP